MISSLAGISPAPVFSAHAGSLLSLDDRVKQRTGIAPPSAKDNVAASILPDFDNDPLAMAFLNGLLRLPSTGNLQEYIDSVNELMVSFVEPATGNLAFKTFEQQKDILQRTLEKVGAETNLAEPLTATLYRTANLNNQMIIWMHEIMSSNGEIKEAEEW
ncbi:hypothetical protein E5C26_20165 [Serratia proteamaculans]|uniref:hypothetical protein n=1 Tax=Serratia proteamaculans TaxID=28151 RepID=UPI001076356E|nr:hypothetical protein [Serratia proteamaculans]TFZ48658.1 hypothetical protein E5C26_20165 [Serratia proteamaculans]